MDPVSHYLFLDGERKGPYTFEQVRHMWRSGAITRDTQHWMDGYEDWMPIEIITPDLEPLPVKPATPFVQTSGPMIRRSKSTYVLLALFLGGFFGVHNFYAKRWGSGVLQLVITILVGWMILPLIPLALWIILECCLVTKDGDGNKMG